jgi:homoserine O-succinyltransferase
MLGRKLWRLPELKILSTSPEAGVYCRQQRGRAADRSITGHSVYDRDTLLKENLRDKNAGLPIEIRRTFPEDDDTKSPWSLGAATPSALIQLLN